MRNSFLVGVGDIWGGGIFGGGVRNSFFGGVGGYLRWGRRRQRRRKCLMLCSASRRPRFARTFSTPAATQLILAAGVLAHDFTRI